jgi:hypothetical protein
VVSLSECLIKAVHLRELQIASVFDDDGNRIWLNVMRQNGSLHCVSWPDNGDPSAVARRLVEAYCMRNRTLSSFLAPSAVERICRRDRPRRLDPFPPALACAQVVSGMGCSMIFLGLLSMGDSIGRPAHRQKRCGGGTGRQY